MYESKQQPVLPSAHFARRLAIHGLSSMALLAGSLGVGILGYTTLEGLSLLDAFLNSAMLLGGMGPVNTPTTAGGKLFAGIYALYAGLVFIFTAALLLAPVFHRVLHRFHLDRRS